MENNDSVQQKLSRVRPPRVHITYDVETGDGIKNKELPFVMGVLGDFSGHAQKASARLSDRRFIEITPDNFDAVLAKIGPQLVLTGVKNTLEPDKPAMAVKLSFSRFEDFDPENVARQVPALQQLLDARTNLADLRSSLQGNVDFDVLLAKYLNNDDERRKLAGELDRASGGQGGNNA